MNDLTRMEAGRPRECAGCSPRGVGCGPPPLDPGAPNPNPARARTDRDQSPPGVDFRSQKPGNLDCQSSVREKVLFLLHPERWLGTQADPAELVESKDLPRIEDHRDSGRERKLSGRRIATAPGTKPRDPEATPRSVLVRVVDYQVTQEVMRTAWTKGRMTTRTEERSVTAVTFRTPRERHSLWGTRAPSEPGCTPRR